MYKRKKKQAQLNIYFIYIWIHINHVHKVAFLNIGFTHSRAQKIEMAFEMLF